MAFYTWKSRLAASNAVTAPVTTASRSMRRMYSSALSSTPDVCRWLWRAFAGTRHRRRPTFNGTNADLKMSISGAPNNPQPIRYAGAGPVWLWTPDVRSPRSVQPPSRFGEGATSRASIMDYDRVGRRWRAAIARTRLKVGEIVLAAHFGECGHQLGGGRFDEDASTHGVTVSDATRSPSTFKSVSGWPDCPTSSHPKAFKALKSII